MGAPCHGCPCLNNTETHKEHPVPLRWQKLGLNSGALCMAGFKWLCLQGCWCCICPTACDCNPLVQWVVMATDGSYGCTSVFTSWAQLGLGDSR